jgi:hypothetical protein
MYYFACCCLVKQALVGRACVLASCEILRMVVGREFLAVFRLIIKKYRNNERVIKNK